MPDLILKQLAVVVDARTTLVCLQVAGRIRPVDDPFTTPLGDYLSPPFHAHCRSFAVPYMAGMGMTVRGRVARELASRTPAELARPLPPAARRAPIRRRRRDRRA